MTSLPRPPRLSARIRGRMDDTEPAVPKKSVAREYFESIVIAVILALFIRTFVVQAFKIPTGSMEKNLLIGDHLLVNKFVSRPRSAPLEAALLGKKHDPARGRRRLQVPRGPGARLHQARDRPARARRSSCATRRSSSTARPLDEPYVHFLEPPLRHDDPEYGLRGESIRDNWGPAGGAGRAALRDGRQPRQQPRQPRSGASCPATRSRAARCSSTGPTRRTGRSTSTRECCEWIRDTAVALGRTRWGRFFHLIR